MTKERFRTLVKRLHPDTGGTPKHSRALQVILAHKACADRRANYCRCGQAIKKESKRCMLCYQRWRKSKLMLTQNIG